MWIDRCPCSLSERRCRTDTLAASQVLVLGWAEGWLIHGRFAQRLARGAKGKRVTQARMEKERRQIEAHQGQLALTGFRVKALSLSLRMRFLSGIIATRKRWRRDDALASPAVCRHPSLASL